ncbi:uncharacterized protein JCM6883_006284 [Sporobolomyces salmoneus]|uniref:uncharacterized protein n=1 Tax=Sporobolomyces salmoneus TaxID=183962 RepID=UPI00317EDBC9
MGKSTLKGAKKATKYRAREAEKEKPFDVKQSRLGKRMETYEDTMGGDEDQFHLNRDKMLLDEDGYAQNGDDDSLDEPDEIYGLNLPDQESSDNEEEEEESEKVEKPRKQRQTKEKKPIYDPKSGRFGHTYDPKQDQVFDSSSGSEASDDDDADDTTPAKDQLESTVSSDEEGEKKKQGSDEDSEDEDRWAAGHYHVSRRAPGEADSEDDEALELEAEEARRLQKKSLEKLRGQDYGLVDSDDEDTELEKGKLEERLDLEEEDGEGKEKIDQEEGKIDTQALNEEESIAHLLKYSPETLALVDDFVRTASKIKDVENDLENVRKVGDGQGGEHPGLAIMELEHQALSTYLPTLAFYFSLLLSPTPQPQSLLTKVLNRISSLRQSLATMEELDLTTATYGEEEEDSDEEGEDEGKMLASEMFDFHNSLNNEGDSEEEDEDEDEEGEEITESMLEGLDDDELEEIMQDVSPEEGAEGLMKRVRQRQREKGMEVPDSSDDSEGEEDGEMLDDEEGSEEEELIASPPPSKKAKKPTAPVIPTLAPLSSSSSRPKPSTSTARSASSTSDYLDPSTLTHGDLADKASTRHSLRFHVSQVAQKAARRERLATAVGGDDDVPRRSKEQARREVLKKQQHGAKDANEAGERLDEGDYDEEDRKAAKAVRGAAAGGDDDGDDGGNDDEDYYDLVKMEKDEGRKAKKAKYDGDRAAEKAEIEALSASMADGPRGATRQILANKGLTPRRKKENRNARVKKRLRYDKAQKKLSSMKATYKGGEARTGYEGEGSGIARRTVKSRQLG